MGVLIAGVLLLAVILGLFYFKDRLEQQWLRRLAYHEVTMRLVVIAVALIFFGAVIAIGDLFG
ncbi:MAG: hypothetical protein HYW28_12590 [Rhodospirillales bacterium]|nr:hypothetical protein [Rhodospirillales bacterium]MBI2586687.1 hypothetical protein [Rhodospirillales bacterium]